VNLKERSEKRVRTKKILKYIFRYRFKTEVEKNLKVRPHRHIEHSHSRLR